MRVQSKMQVHFCRIYRSLITRHQHGFATEFLLCSGLSVATDDPACVDTCFPFVEGPGEQEFLYFCRMRYGPKNRVIRKKGGRINDTMRHWRWQQTRRNRWKMTAGIASVSIVAWGIAIAAILATPTTTRVWLWEALLADIILLGTLVIGVRWVVCHRVLAFWQHRAAVDDLMQLLRPGSFWEWTEERAGIRGSWPWVIVYCDVDDFKQCNDQWGHATGDAILQQWGQILRQQSRQDDILSRLGGEEVGWWLPHTTLAEARMAVERVLRICQNTAIDSLSGFSFSAGIAQGRPGESVGNAARRADHALYRAKQAGKGRVVDADEEG